MNLVFWAQALDNTAPDHIEWHGEGVPPEDSAQREKAASLIASIVKVGMQRFKKSGVRLIDDGQRFMLEVPTAQKDLEGRTAPIVCCGEYSPSLDGPTIALKIKEFAHRIGRTVTPEGIDLAKLAFLKQKKNYRMRNVMGWAVLIAILLAALVITAISLALAIPAWLLD